MWLFSSFNMWNGLLSHLRSLWTLNYEVCEGRWVLTSLIFDFNTPYQMIDSTLQSIRNPAIYLSYYFCLGSSLHHLLTRIFALGTEGITCPILASLYPVLPVVDQNQRKSPCRRDTARVGRKKEFPPPENKKFTQYLGLWTLTLKAWGNVSPTQPAATLCEATSLRQTLVAEQRPSVTQPLGNTKTPRRGVKVSLRNTTNLTVKECCKTIYWNVNLCFVYLPTPSS